MPDSCRNCENVAVRIRSDLSAAFGFSASSLEPGSSSNLEARPACAVEVAAPGGAVGAAQSARDTLGSVIKDRDDLTDVASDIDTVVSHA